MHFQETLPESERHFVRRLEGFGDIVFGFSMSQLALQLVQPNAPAELLHVFRFVVYFGTFAALVGLWLNFHRMMSGAFEPTRIDVFIAFAYLAFATTFPWAMNVLMHLSSHPEWVRAGFGVYLCSSVGTTLPAAIIAWRNYRRGSPYFDDVQRLRVWRRLITVTSVSVNLLIALGIDAFVPVDLLWNAVPPAVIPLALIAVVIRIAVALFAKKPPRWSETGPAA
jgi:uncharacterized membrane protein